ncbi:MAG: tripartite tricarboxylate transporter substrate binding protein [Rhizobiales bacterium]|nr:tripartite tricarboxylate transporter substrate binding protein [Hyphomicrobiales bacterium]
MKAVQRLRTCVLMALMFCVVADRSSRAETWPTRPITILVGAGPGGSMDTIARVLAEYATKQLGQPVVVENRAGGGGVVAAVAVARGPPDGYTIALQAVGPMVLRPIMDPAVGYNPAKDFSPIVLVGDTPNVILGGAKFPAHTVRETVDWAKKNPGRLNIGHPGPGTMGHLAALLLASNSGIAGTYIAYRSGGAMLPDLLGGQIDIAVAAYTPQLKAAPLLAVMTAEPLAFLPGVPSMREAGYPGVYASTWFGLFGPPNLPRDIVEKLNTAVNDFLRGEEAQKHFAILGFRSLGGSPEVLAKKIADDKILWSKVIKDADIKLGDK